MSAAAAATVRRRGSLRSGPFVNGQSINDIIGVDWPIWFLKDSTTQLFTFSFSHAIEIPKLKVFLTPQLSYDMVEIQYVRLLL